MAGRYQESFPEQVEQDVGRATPPSWGGDRGHLAFYPPLSACPSYPGLPSPRVPVSFLPYLPTGIEHCMGVGWGWPRTQEVPSGGLWARPELASALGGKDIPRSLRNLHSPLLPLPPLYPQLQRRRALGGGWRGLKLQSQLCCLPGLWRAEQAMALDSQPPPLARLTISTPFLLSSPLRSSSPL